MRVRTVAALAMGSVLALTACSPTVHHPSGTPSTATSPISRTAAPAHVAAAGAPATRATSRPARPPAPNHCSATAGAAKAVVVIVHLQRLWLCAHGHEAFTTPVTTGAVDNAYQSTPTGTFTIQGKNTDTTLTLNTGQTYAVHYWIPFQAPLFGFHDASWQTFPFGSRKYRTEGSHGCVHMPLAAIAHLYRWASIGTPVTIST